jgi:hypothetical protein
MEIQRTVIHNYPLCKETYTVEVVIAMVVRFTSICTLSDYYLQSLSCILVHGEVCLIQHHVINFVRYVRQDGRFLFILLFLLSTLTESHNVTETVLKNYLNLLRP